MKVAIVGASGAVGQEFIKVLEEKNFPLTELVLFGSSRSAGNEYMFKGAKIKVQELTETSDFSGITIALTSAGAGTSKKFASVITRNGTIMIDNSSAFRMDDDVPLVVPEINAKDCWNIPRRIIANPNCTTIQLVIALHPIEAISHIKRVHIATYQSASGAGATAMVELQRQLEQIVQGKPVDVEKFQHQLALNLIPHVDTAQENDYTREEMKMFYETRKIMHTNVKVSATAVRVPVMRAHSEAIWVETEKSVSVEQARKAFEEAEGVVLEDDLQKNSYPMPLFKTGQDPVYVGRVRKDLSHENGLAFWTVSDQIRKGAALNAVQIAEYLVETGIVK